MDQTLEAPALSDEASIVGETAEATAIPASAEVLITFPAEADLETPQAQNLPALPDLDLSNAAYSVFRRLLWSTGIAVAICAFGTMAAPPMTAQAWTSLSASSLSGPHGSQSGIDLTQLAFIVFVSLVVMIVPFASGILETNIRNALRNALNLYVHSLHNVRDRARLLISQSRLSQTQVGEIYQRLENCQLKEHQSTWAHGRRNLGLALASVTPWLVAYAILILVASHSGHGKGGAASVGLTLFSVWITLASAVLALLVRSFIWAPAFRLRYLFSRVRL